MSSSIRIREPLRTEIPQLADLGCQLFRQTFDGLYSDQDLQEFLDGVYSPAGVALDWDTGCEFWIVEARGQGANQNLWVGYCKIGPVRVPVQTHGRRVLELRQIYLDRQYQGCGIGTKLMQIFLNCCETRRIEDAFVSCWTGNAQALAFYGRFGFEIVDTYDFMIGSHRDRDHILQKRFTGKS